MINSQLPLSLSSSPIRLKRNVHPWRAIYLFLATSESRSITTSATSWLVKLNLYKNNEMTLSPDPNSTSAARSTVEGSVVQIYSASHPLELSKWRTGTDRVVSVMRQPTRNTASDMCVRACACVVCVCVSCAVCLCAGCDFSQLLATYVSIILFILKLDGLFSISISSKNQI